MQSHLSEGEQLLKDIEFEFRTQHFVAFDIEAVTQKCYNFDNPQQIISIGCRASWRKSGEIFHRENSFASSGQKLVKEFINYLDKLHMEFLSFLPLAEVEAKMELITKLNFASEGAKRAAENTLKGLKRLKIFSFKGERYDSVCLYPYLVALFGENNQTSNVIKRGSGKL